MKIYENMEVERERSKYPRGLKHYSKETITENSLFDIDLALYKLKSIWKGICHEEDTTRHKEENQSSPGEVLRGYLLRLLYQDWDPDSDSGEDRTVEGRYLEIDEREREEYEESKSECEAQAEKTQNED